MCFNPLNTSEKIQSHEYHQQGYCATNYYPKCTLLGRSVDTKYRGIYTLNCKNIFLFFNELSYVF